MNDLTKKRQGRGGARPGAGRKAKPEHEKAQQVSVSLMPDELAAYYELKRRNDIDVNRFVGKELRHKAAALDLIDMGF